ncbi:MAG: phage integrase N-terminal SAM-like domain-containing protein [Gammaproteobacteria bacterium]|nr:phage integrase N-terminal SAM-like domain-containing protein [Gammaproteobacteria bacterium]
MASLKKVFIDCMQVRHFSPKTQTAYLHWVNALIKETHQLPNTLSDQLLPPMKRQQKIPDLLTQSQVRRRQSKSAILMVTENLTGGTCAFRKRC